MQRHVIAVLAMGLVAAACTSQATPERDALPAITAPTTTTTTPIAVAEADAARVADVSGRVLVLRADSSILSVRADGSEMIEHAPPADSEDGGRVIERSQPTWSPDGSQIAWTERVGEDSYELVIGGADGVDLSRTSSPMLAQYLDWSPGADAIAFMGNDFFGAMTLAYAPAGGDAQIIDSGAPMYIDWNATGDVLLTHIEGRLEQRDPTMDEKRVITADGQFRVAVFNGGDVLATLDGGEQGEILALSDAAGGDPDLLMRVTDPTAVVAHEPSGRLALMSTWNAESVRFAENPPADLPALIPEQLTVLDLASGGVEVVHEGRAVSWSWNPDGSVLLFSTLEFIEDSQKIVWHTWDGIDVTRYSHFTPTARFGNSYLAFFDQHERSTTRWSPDGRAFVYAGGIVDGPRGIWVQPLDGGDPVLITDGINATWSP